MGIKWKHFSPPEHNKREKKSFFCRFANKVWFNNNIHGFLGNPELALLKKKTLIEIKFGTNILSHVAFFLSTQKPRKFVTMCTCCEYMTELKLLDGGCTMNCAVVQHNWYREYCSKIAWRRTQGRRELAEGKSYFIHFFCPYSLNRCQIMRAVNYKDWIEGFFAKFDFLLPRYNIPILRKICREGRGTTHRKKNIRNFRWTSTISCAIKCRCMCVP